MSRSWAIGPVIALVALVGCGMESTSGDACRDEYVELYTKAVRLLNEASPNDSDIDERMTKVLGTEPAKACRKDPRSANDTLEQVAREFDPQFAALEGKWGTETLSGFRDPLGAGHGDPVQRDSRSPAP
ncbi:MAG: hypothetical protein ACT4QG_10445 [Sporichthyaceae bacterium]